MTNEFTKFNSIIYKYRNLASYYHGFIHKCNSTMKQMLQVIIFGLFNCTLSYQFMNKFVIK